MPFNSRLCITIEISVVVRKKIIYQDVKKWRGLLKHSVDWPMLISKVNFEIFTERERHQYHTSDFFINSINVVV